MKSIALAAGQGGGTRSYCYDANGNLVSYSMSGGTAGSFSAKYDHDNLPYYTSRSATLATRTASITYDADGGRVRQMGTPSRQPQVCHVCASALAARASRLAPT